VSSRDTERTYVMVAQDHRVSRCLCCTRVCTLAASPTCCAGSRRLGGGSAAQGAVGSALATARGCASPPQSSVSPLEASGRELSSTHTCHSGCLCCRSEQSQCGSRCQGGSPAGRVCTRRALATGSRVRRRCVLCNTSTPAPLPARVSPPASWRPRTVLRAKRNLLCCVAGYVAWAMCAGSLHTWTAHMRSETRSAALGPEPPQPSVLASQPWSRWPALASMLCVLLCAAPLPRVWRVLLRPLLAPLAAPARARLQRLLPGARALPGVTRGVCPPRDSAVTRRQRHPVCKRCWHHAWACALR
jgi:hypothetical protein